jgi:hypothetical protein
LTAKVVKTVETVTYCRPDHFNPAEPNRYRVVSNMTPPRGLVRARPAVVPITVQAYREPPRTGDRLEPSSLGLHEGWRPVIRDEAPIGRVGVLILGTRGANGPGEVLVRVRGGRETYIAWSEQPLPKDANVLIIESRGARTVDVIEWMDAPDNGDESG